MKKLLPIFATLFLLLSCAENETITWKPAGDKIMTEWGENIDPNNVLPEYPRPQLVRGEWINLNGLWDYAIKPANEEMPEIFDGKILVPFAVESALSGVGKSVGVDDALWYSREFKLPKEWKNSRIRLNFGAVDWKAEVYVDDKFVGEHKGGYAPFAFDITDSLSKKKTHKLVVKVTDGTDSAFQPRGKQVANPNGIWYTAVTGIWQTVWMEPVNEVVVESYSAKADIEKSILNVRAIARGAKVGDDCLIELIENGEVISSANGADVILNVENPKLWSPDSPYLYDLRITIYRNGEILDQVMGYAAMREISVVVDKKGYKRMALNGEPLFQYGTLDQGWWPDGLYTAPTDEALKFDIEKTKEFGFNMIRKHVKVEPARWYWHCDHIGMLVWQDMPNIHDNSLGKWGRRHYDEGIDTPVPNEWKDNYCREWKEIIQTNEVFPSIVMWVPFNEAWGQFNTEEIVQYTKFLDDSRLVNYASGGNFVRCSGDVLDLHNYPNPAMYLFDIDYVNVMGEYGGIGFPLEGHLWQTDKNWGYIQYKNADEVADTYEEYANELIGFVKKGFSGAIYTQTTDVEGEVNGLMTYDRKVIKLDVDRIKAINSKVIASMTE
ncbi:MAG: beta-galactosidase [Bacteroidales bacterium]|nr:beta-galactosidase [Bacteroidales bacterium]